jgi:hypothetical protein
VIVASSDTAAFRAKDGPPVRDVTEELGSVTSGAHAEMAMATAEKAATREDVDLLIGFLGCYDKVPAVNRLNP